jgi:hypothetical protein
LNPSKKNKNGKQFATDINVKQAVTSSLQMLGHKFLLYQGASLGTNAAVSMVSTRRSNVYQVLSRIHSKPQNDYDCTVES